MAAVWWTISAKDFMLGDKRKLIWVCWQLHSVHSELTFSVLLTGIEAAVTSMKYSTEEVLLPRR